VEEAGEKFVAAEDFAVVVVANENFDLHTHS
jgi:hypothetical protein